MDPDLELRSAVYGHFVENGGAPDADALARMLGWTTDAVGEGLTRLATRRMLVLAPGRVSIAMALPFSAVETAHEVYAKGRTYYANCAWDAFGIPAALHADAEVRSRCGQSGDALTLSVGSGRVPASAWRFHAAVPAVHWWRDIFYT